MAVIGIGVDLVEIERLDRMLRERGERLLARLFTDQEVAYCMARSLAARHFAARVAAKEAAFKALAGSDAARAIGWKELEISNSPLGIPQLRMHGRAQARAELLGVNHVHVSITHGDKNAVAVVVLER
jgi:holo-[acyl-carrier protein] synthase